MVNSITNRRESNLMHRGRKTSNKTIKALLKLKKLPLFALSTAKHLGLSQPTVARLLKKGVINRIGPGIYQVNDTEAFDPATVDYVKATEQFGNTVVVGGLTALYLYGLIDEVPEQIWLLVPPSVRSTDSQYRTIRTTRNLSVGVLRKKGFKIASLDRAIIDAFIFSTKIGASTGLSAAVRALRRKHTTERKMFEMARSLGVLKRVISAWESVNIAMES
jgi:predicted transcriptional regulator of viral defense system